MFSSGASKKESVLLTPKYALHRLQKQLVKSAGYGLPGTDGSWSSNFKSYLFNNHTLLSVCLANPAHPFSRFERLIFVFINLSFIFSLSAIFNHSPSNEDETVNAIVVAILTYPFKTLARFMMECGCLYTGGFVADTDKAKGKAVHAASSAIECFGSLATCGICCFAMIMLLIGILILASSSGGNGFVFMWIQSQLYSFIGTEVIITMIMHRIFMNGDKEKFNKKWELDFPPEAPPVSLTDVGRRAMSSFLYDIDKYNDDPNKENLNSSIDPLINFRTRFPHYMEYFKLENVDVHPSKPWQPPEGGGQGGVSSADMERGGEDYTPVSGVEMVSAQVVHPASPEVAAQIKWSGKYDADGRMVGEGLAEYPDGSSYRGFMRYSRRLGKGKFRYANNDMYEGEFAEDMRHGHGVLRDAVGKKIFKGQWQNDRRHKSDFF